MTISATAEDNAKGLDYFVENKVLPKPYYILTLNPTQPGMFVLLKLAWTLYLIWAWQLRV